MFYICTNLLRIDFLFFQNLTKMNEHTDLPTLYLLNMSYPEKESFMSEIEYLFESLQNMHND